MARSAGDWLSRSWLGSDAWSCGMRRWRRQRRSSLASAHAGITSVSPASSVGGRVGDDHGNELRCDSGNKHGDIQRHTATPTSWSATSIAVPVPAGATTGPVVVTVNGVSARERRSPCCGPSISSLSPTSAAVGAPVTIAGANFGSDSRREHRDIQRHAATATSWSAASIVSSGSGGSDDGQCGGDGKRRGQRRSGVYSAADAEHQ